MSNQNKVDWIVNGISLEKALRDQDGPAAAAAALSIASATNNSSRALAASILGVQAATPH
ncbi:MAG: hypothetical protein Q4C79_06990 [Neisseria sp.]|uniref:hypothetical protein n=1 Tax=Neisseria sp. TaxID=192066 RepID=UPI0026DB9E66|nr:hypothetical protein [Neisseria sp.]MDO4248690.1 hypothetical protein [Neisseria sp.]